MQIRALIAMVQTLGRCPCVWCIISKEKIADMGTVLDMKNRIKLACSDTPHWQLIIKRTRNLMFKLGLAVTYNAVEFLLGATSMVLTWVSFKSSKIYIKK
jgi:hypothetical protein